MHQDLLLIDQELVEGRRLDKRQIGYTIADVLAKCVFGLTILKIAKMKSVAEGMKDDH